MALSYFDSVGEADEELWVTDGTAEGTHFVASFGVGAIYNLTTIGSRVFFDVDDGVHGRELWTSDGTAAGTMLVKDINPGSGSSSFDYLDFLTNVNGTLYFTAGRNPKSLSGEELCAEGWVDAGSEALSAQGAACLIGLEEVVSSVSNDGEVQGRGVFSGSAAVFVEGHVHRPMEIVLYPPVGAHRGENGLGIGFEGGDVVAGFEAFATGL